MIICVEGPSAIGKSTMCRSFSDRYLIVPEANELFERVFPEENEVYLEFQMKRYQMAASSRLYAVLDGDHLQPVWYNWTYGFPAEYQSPEVLRTFYTQAFSDGSMGFPDLYIFYGGDVDLIRSRRDGDTTRSRRSFEKHLSLIESQKQYFDLVSRQTTIEVEFIEYNQFDRAREATLERINAVSPRDRTNDIRDLKTIFDLIESEVPSKT